MARRPRRQSPRTPAAATPPQPKPAPERSIASSEPTPFWTSWRLGLAVFALLTLHVTLAIQSLILENPTVDEVVHLPAGVSYWEQGTFRLYHHNPPLIKLIAALPVVWSKPRTAELYNLRSWTGNPPDQATFAHFFAFANAGRYFELFTRARLLMPAFSVLGGLVVFSWSRRLYGPGGGLLSLALWTLCPNVLAHCRLVTSDIGATALGVTATFLFWRYLHRPTWTRATLAGLFLGLAQLSKFSMILLYAVWPSLWVIRELHRRAWTGLFGRTLRAAAQGLWMVVLSVLVIDAGYLFEGVGIPLGDRVFEFASRPLTRPIEEGTPRPDSPNELFARAWQHRVNRFRGTIFGRIPSPLPEHFLLGFDEQKLESEGLPRWWFSQLRSGVGGGDEVIGYPVYLNGDLRQSGWWYYYFLALAYKVPEGTIVLVLLSLAVLIGSPRSRATWDDELAVLIIPIVLLFTMSVLTDINLGLRYVLPIFPYVYISTGKVVPWARGLASRGQRIAAGLLVGSCVGATALATLAIHPHYLAYFNEVSGGPERGSDHLIDSNLDWGQDLIGLRQWLAAHAPGERVGLALFGQINPNLFKHRGEALEWFVPPGLPETIEPMSREPKLPSPAPPLTPGLYAVSASLMRGLPWRVYDPNPSVVTQQWRARAQAFAYFRQLTPIASIGHSIFVYRVTREDANRLAPLWDTPKSVKSDAG